MPTGLALFRKLVEEIPYLFENTLEDLRSNRRHMRIERLFSIVRLTFDPFGVSWFNRYFDLICGIGSRST